MLDLAAKISEKEISMSQGVNRLIFLMGLMLLVFVGSPLAKEKTAEDSDLRTDSGRVYLPVQDQILQVDKLLEKAVGSKKLALIVMGANWCHDSRSLAKKLFDVQLQSKIEKNYEVSFVDVGFLENIKPVITRFGIPIIYATPTVLVVDPESGQVINRDNMHIWRSAAKINHQETLEYFEEIATNRYQKVKQLKAVDAGENPRLLALNESINEFEQTQAIRLYQAFEIVGPLLKADIAGEATAESELYWKALSKYRRKLTNDLVALRVKAKELSRSDESSTKTLDFPTYSKLAWEE
jgi:hypothetical protein